MLSSTHSLPGTWSLRSHIAGTVALVAIVVLSVRAAEAQACAPVDSRAERLIGIAQSFLTDPDEAPRRALYRVPSADTSTVRHVTDNAVCERVLAAWAASGYAQHAVSVSVSAVTFGGFYMIRMCAPQLNSRCESYALLNAQFEIVWRFALI